MLILTISSGCTVVMPYEREVLAKPIMQFASDKEEAAAREHFYNSMEGSTGGFGAGGGGCGCN